MFDQYSSQSRKFKAYMRVVVKEAKATNYLTIINFRCYYFYFLLSLRIDYEFQNLGCCLQVKDFIIFLIEVLQPKALASLIKKLFS